MNIDFEKKIVNCMIYGLFFILNDFMADIVMHQPLDLVPWIQVFSSVMNVFLPLFLSPCYRPTTRRAIKVMITKTKKNSAVTRKQRNVGKLFFSKQKVDDIIYYTIIAFEDSGTNTREKEEGRKYFV